MSISPSGVHDENARVFAYCFGKRFGAGLYDDISPTDQARQRRIQRWTRLIILVQEFGDDDLIFQARLALSKRIRWRKCCCIGRLTDCPLIELPFTATSPKYANSFWARFWV